MLRNNSLWFKSGEGPYFDPVHRGRPSTPHTYAQMTYQDLSFWLQDSNDALIARPRLQRSEDVDVAILGGGYTGLWTAYFLLRANPNLKVAIVESEIAGYGASGRNGGWCSPRFPVSAGAMTRRWGSGAARAVLDALQSSVDSIQTVCEEESIDACFRSAGTLTVARGAHQLPALRSAYAAYEKLGLAGRYQFLSPEQVAERVRITDVHGGLYTPDGASLHPGRLVRGLARAVEARGGQIYEQTRVTGFRAANAWSGPALITEAGEIRARKAVVLAGEAYLTRLPSLHRALLPVYSLISITEPLTADKWADIGWRQGENLASARNTVVYLTRTHDGRILFGSRGAPYKFGSAITDAQDRHAETHALIQRSLLEWFPSLSGICFTHSWGGPVGMPIDWTPAVRFSPRTRIAFAGGYTGQGVSTANLAGQMLAAMIVSENSSASAFTSLPFAQRTSPAWIPEPIRWLVVRYMQRAFERIDEAAESGRPTPIDAPIANFLGRH
jgi:glycine/D-amino acid oxidase-like deaminating enzyme